MATSGSVNFNLTRDQIIRSAYEIVGVAVEGEALDSSEISIANVVLNMMLKAYQAYDLQLWKKKELSLTLVAAQSSYTIGRSGTPDLTADRPLKIIECEREDSNGNDADLTWVARSEIFGQSSSTGTPTQYHYEPTLSNGTLRVWPTPDATAASTWTLKLLVQSPIEDMDNSTDDFDCPQEWYEAITMNLAYRLSSRYPLPIEEKRLLRADSEKALQLALGFDVEESIYFQPDK